MQVPSAFVGFRLPPELIDAACPCRHRVGDRWFVDETYVEVNGVWRYVYRAVDQHGQVIEVLVSKHRDIASARRFFSASLLAREVPAEVITDRAPALANVIEDLIPVAFHNTGQYENNRCECDHGRLKARLRPMRGLKTDRPTGPRASSSEGTRSSRTSAAATTSWGSKCRRCSGWRPPSTNTISPSDQKGRQPRCRHAPRSRNATPPGHARRQESYRRG